MKTTILPCSFDNYSYLIVCRQTGQAAVVDPTEAYPVFRAVQQSSAKLIAVLCTHHHQDHIGGLEDLLAELPVLKVYGHESDHNRIPGLNQPLKDGGSIAIGGMQVKVLYTPGHTKGSVVYGVEGGLFTGDTMFGAGCGRLFEGTAAQMHASLNRVVSAFPQETKVYFGHEYTIHNLNFAMKVEPGNEAVAQRLSLVSEQRERGVPSSPSTLGEELQTNPFLRCHSPGLIEGLRSTGGENLESEVEVFSRLRELRNSF